MTRTITSTRGPSTSWQTARQPITWSRSCVRPSARPRGLIFAGSVVDGAMTVYWSSLILGAVGLVVMALIGVSHLGHAPRGHAAGHHHAGGRGHAALHGRAAGRGGGGGGGTFRNTV